MVKGLPEKPYFSGMKSCLFILLVSLVLSCQNNTPASGPATQPVIRDTALPKRKPVNPYSPVDISPLDIVYFPTNYSVQKMNGAAKSPPVARVIYSRPQRQGRQIFGNIVRWGEPWRLGANEATEIELFQPVTIQSKRVEKGRYILYAVPQESQWTIVFNGDLYTWGLKFNLARDKARFTVPALTKDRMIEYFTMVFEKTATGADLVMAWENKEARLPLQF